MVFVVLAACGEKKPPETTINVEVDAGPSAPIVLVAAPSPSAPERSRAPAADGPKAPSFSLKSLTGGRCELASGKVTIVDFWATWCEPCKKAFPKLQDLYVKYRASGLEIAAVSVDDEPNDIAAFAHQYRAQFPVGWDDGHRLAEQFKVQSMPSTYIVDRDGVVRHTHAGYHDGEDAEIEREIKELL
jgi:peroxiredoxin